MPKQQSPPEPAFLPEEYRAGLLAPHHGLDRDGITSELFDWRSDGEPLGEEAFTARFGQELGSAVFWLCNDRMLAEVEAAKGDLYLDIVLRRSAASKFQFLTWHEDPFVEDRLVVSNIFSTQTPEQLKPKPFQLLYLGPMDTHRPDPEGYYSDQTRVKVQISKIRW